MVRRGSRSPYVGAAAGIAVMLLGLANAGCAAEPSLPGVGRLDPDTVALIPPSGAGMDALLEGRLHGFDDCVIVTISASGEPVEVLPVFPSDTVRWDGDQLSYGGTSFGEGDEVALGGGFIREPTSSRALPAEAHIPAHCPTDYVFLVAS